ncbi:MAG: primosomal protein N' [Patescibacteria group bacterium]
MIVNVIPESRTFSDVESFSYLVPEKLDSQIETGSIVAIPFGKKRIRGIVSAINYSSSDSEKSEVKNTRQGSKSSYQLKEILSVDHSFSLPKEYLEIAKWISDYYLCSLGEAISLFLPPEMKRPHREKAECQKPKAESKKQLKLLNKEQEEIFQILRSELSPTETLNPVQGNGNVLPQKKPVLIHGVTGSGKTEIYIKLAAETIKHGKQVVVLVPEIMLTPQTVERFQKVFGDTIALMHHSLSKSEKFNCFYDFYSGAKSIIIGPRSALLVPSKKLGLIIIDEEQEDAYKQEQNPRYHAVTLAKEIASKNNSLLVLGTATPRIETYFQVKNARKLFVLSKRHHQNELPATKIVDLRNEIRAGNFSPISGLLEEEIRQVLSEKRQILLFLNRRGTATFVSCRDCGQVLLCPNCSIPMVYHVNDRSSFLHCHHCDSKEPLPSNCPACHSSKIKFFGTGIEKIEREITKLFPNARIAKIDSTTINKKADYTTFFDKFKRGEIDIVVGTQMIAKGLDIPGVDLVGIVSADTGLHLPHYRASEKSFNLITQVSGRSGRLHNQGKTILQTYWPEALPILAASEHAYELFYEKEIVERQKFKYPPFSKLIRIISENPREDLAKKEIDSLATKFREQNIEFIGPGQCFYARMHNKYRYHIIVKSDKIPNETIKNIRKDFPKLTWDVDPTNLL